MLIRQYPMHLIYDFECENKSSEKLLAGITFQVLLGEWGAKWDIVFNLKQVIRMPLQYNFEILELWWEHFHRLCLCSCQYIPILLVVLLTWPGWQVLLWLEIYHMRWQDTTKYIYEKKLNRKTLDSVVSISFD